MMRWMVSGLILMAGVWLQTSCSPGNRAEETAAEPGVTRREFDVKGTVLGLQPAEQRVRIRHETIPGYMDAMTMPFRVQDTNELAGLIPGEEITFTLIVTDDDAWIERLEKTGVAKNVLPEGAGIRIAREVEPLGVGDPLPDYPFIDQEGRKVRLSQFRGKVLVLSFLFTRCPIPTFCPLTARKLAETQDRLLAERRGLTNWHLLAITVDPEFDTPERLRQFGQTYGYEPQHWSLLTGDLIDITALAEQFGLLFWTEDGTVSHNLRTVVVGADGLIRTNLIGNEWAVDTLIEQVERAAETSRNE